MESVLCTGIDIIVRMSSSTLWKYLFRFLTLRGMCGMFFATVSQKYFLSLDNKRTMVLTQLREILTHFTLYITVLCRTVVTSIVVRFWPRVSIVVRFLRQIISDYFLKKFRYLSKYLIYPIGFSFKLSTVLVANHRQKVFDEFIIELWKNFEISSFLEFDPVRHSRQKREKILPGLA